MEILEKFAVKGLVHITGGGLVDNIPRVLPAGCKAVINKDSWPALPIFSLLRKEGNITEEEMFKVFNMGIGMAVIVPENEAEDLRAELVKAGEKVYLIGEVNKGDKVVEII